MLLTQGIPPAFRGGVHLFIPPTVIIGSESRVCQVAHYLRTDDVYCLPQVRRHRTSSPQGSSSKGCYLFRYHHGPINVHLEALFPYPLTVQHQIQPSYYSSVENERTDAGRDGRTRLARPNYPSRGRGQGKHHFPCSADYEHDW